MTTTAAGPRARRRFVMTATFAASAALVLGACSGHQDAARLEVIGPQNTVEDLPAATPDQGYLFPLPGLCTSSTPIELTGLTPWPAGGGLEIVDWGVRDRAPGDDLGSVPGALPGSVSQYRGFAHGPVASPCSAHDRSAELYISVRIDGSSGSFDGVSVGYRSGGEQRQVRVHYPLTLCTATDCG